MVASPSDAFLRLISAKPLWAPSGDGGTTSSYVPTFRACSLGLLGGLAFTWAGPLGQGWSHGQGKGTALGPPPSPFWVIATSWRKGSAVTDVPSLPFLRSAHSRRERVTASERTPV